MLRFSFEGLVEYLQLVGQGFKGTVGSGQEHGHTCWPLLMLPACSHTKGFQHLGACPPAQPGEPVAARASRETLGWKEAGLECTRVVCKVMPSPCHQ